MNSINKQTNEQTNKQTNKQKQIKVLLCMDVYMRIRGCVEA